jgi:HK97 gp10 family phage protein
MNPIGTYAKVSGLESLAAQIEARSKNIQRAIAIGVNRGAELIRTETVKKIKNVGRGEVYERGKGRVHQASAPGDPPAWDFGKLVRGFKVINATPGPVCTAKFASTTAYGPALEFGTRYMEPRPFMQPTEKVLKDAEAMLRVEIQKATQA